jgi:hypothetical protein
MAQIVRSSEFFIKLRFVPLSGPKASASFFAKKEAKKLLVLWALASPSPRPPANQKFFGSFFQKRTACLLFQPAT